MSTGNNGDIKQKLIEEKNEINKRIESVKQGDPFLDPDHANFNAAVDEDAREQESHQRIEAELETLYARLEDIDEALKRAEKGSYGTCKRCNKEIPAKRLELIPETVYCVHCEEELKK